MILMIPYFKNIIYIEHLFTHWETQISTNFEYIQGNLYIQKIFTIFNSFYDVNQVIAVIEKFS